MILYQMVKRMEERMNRKQLEKQHGEDEKRTVQHADKLPENSAAKLLHMERKVANDDIEIVLNPVADLLQHPTDAQSREIVNS